MTNEEIDALWNRALGEAIKKGEAFTRYEFYRMVASAEREACAKLFDGPVFSYDYREIAAAIRARGEV